MAQERSVSQVSAEAILKAITISLSFRSPKGHLVNLLDRNRIQKLEAQLAEGFPRTDRSPQAVVLADPDNHVSLAVLKGHVGLRGRGLPASVVRDKVERVGAALNSVYDTKGLSVLFLGQISEFVEVANAGSILLEACRPPDFVSALGFKVQTDFVGFSIAREGVDCHLGFGLSSKDEEGSTELGIRVVFAVESELGDPLGEAVVDSFDQLLRIWLNEVVPAAHSYLLER